MMLKCPNTSTHTHTLTPTLIIPLNQCRLQLCLLQRSNDILYSFVEESMNLFLLSTIYWKPDHYCSLPGLPGRKLYFVITWAWGTVTLVYQQMCNLKGKRVIYTRVYKPESGADRGWWPIWSMSLSSCVRSGYDSRDDDKRGQSSAVHPKLSGRISIQLVSRAGCCENTYNNIGDKTEGNYLQICKPSFKKIY